MDTCTAHVFAFFLEFQALKNFSVSFSRKRAMVDVGDLVLRKDSTPKADGAADATALGTEVFQALQATASDAWGEGSLGLDVNCQLPFYFVVLSCFENLVLIDF